ncbi:MAG: tetratricopeptide repeat protein [Sediminibacterium sp.]|nr:tetratricopeptide repeat protein [Sediminibacterium sp.]
MDLMKLRIYGGGKSRNIAYCTVIFSLFTTLHLAAQPHLSLEIKKPKKYESRTLPSEKSGEKKFTAPKRLYNNTVSRFNYYFNANNIFNEVIAQAKEAHKDDYTQLLPFYNYAPDPAFKDKMDSVLYKTTAGIVLHDLRSDWVDKLYLLMGKAYLYRRDFDSATTVFQFINYAFAPKDNGYDLPIGSNASNTNGVFTIATRENRSLWKKMTSFPPSRNESFLWQVRTYIEQDELTEASSLLELIRTDPNFPARLQTDLHEMMAYAYYKQQQYANSAEHLLQALGNAENKFETARWEYLAAQLYQLAGNDTQAMGLFERSIQHTTDPLMEVYARLNIVGLATGNQENSLQKNLDELLKMAKRDKYGTQRDIIYYAAAELELKRKNYPAAQALLLKSIQFNDNNPEQKQLSFLLLGDMNYARKAYSPSYNFYDSIDVALLKDINKQRVIERKPALQIISENETVVHREDSLQKLALLPVEERTALVKKLLKQLRKEKGLKDLASEPSYGSLLLPGSPSAPAAVDMFGNTASEFYFQNTSLKARGAGEFKTRWGTRPNVDNWRRQAAVDRTLTVITPLKDQNALGATAKKEADTELTLDALTKNIPLNNEQSAASNKAIIGALLSNALTFQNQLEDYPSAIEMYEELIRRYPESSEVEQALYNLAYCYKKAGQPEKAQAIAAQLKRAYPTGKLTAQLNEVAVTKKNDPAQPTYEAVYRLFVEGKFDAAKEAKLAADKQFGKSYWTPQLLYIESVYYIKQKEDSIAINRLENITTLFKTSPLAEKAATMIDVLKRRSQIEAYLANLDLSKNDDLAGRRVDLNSTDPLTVKSSRKDSLANAPKELKSGGKELVNLSNTNAILSQPLGKKDSMPVVVPKELTGKEIANVTKPTTFSNKTFAFNPADTQYVVLMLENVDPIFVTESRNAFNRFNQERYTDRQIDIANRRVNPQFQFLMFGPFANAADAVTYIDKTRPLTGTRIIPWLAADKFNFIIISNANMEVLINTQDVAGYRTFMHGIFPDKF